MKNLRAISTDDSVNACDCCGKTGLKYTVVMVDGSGEIFHYGSTCAQRNSGKDTTTIKHEIAKDIQDRIIRATNEYNQCSAKLWREMKESDARELGLIGKQFREYCKPEQDFDAVIKRRIAEDYNLKPYEF